MLDFFATTARRMHGRTQHSVVIAAGTLALGIAGAGCQSKPDRVDPSRDSTASADAMGRDTARDGMAAGTMTRTPDSTDAGKRMGTMTNMSGDADQDFRRMMSDHHKGLVALAHLSVEGTKKGSSGVQSDARKLDVTQDKEITQMTAMLASQFKDSYTPRITPENQAMIDGLKGLAGEAFNRAFYASVITHHQQALQMIDSAMPTLKHSEIKAMAEKMKRDQTAEIAEYQRKAPAR